MSAQDHPRSALRPAPGPRVGGIGWRWLAELIWALEHAFERERAAKRPEEDTRVRIFLVLGLFCFIFGALAAGATHRALLAGHGAHGHARQPGALARADLVDRNGRLLAANIVHYGLYVNPVEVWDREIAYRRIRRALPRVPAERLRRALYGADKAVVITGLTAPERAAVHSLALGGISFEAEDARVYPLGSSAAHVIGATERGGPGISGAEKAFDAEIRAAGARGEAFPLSIDLRVQAVVESELAAAVAETGAKGAAAVVMDAHSGEVLAMGSWPFDGVMNLATTARFEMGSVLKSFAVATGLDTGKTTMSTLFDASHSLHIGGRRIDDYHATNRVLTLEEVYLKSSNIGTSLLANMIGPRDMRAYFGRFGLLKAAPIELNESAGPVLPPDWSPSTLASLSFGYGIAVTPIQVAAGMAALANGGFYVTPSLRRGGASRPPRRVISEETSLAMLDLMRRNVVRGSGKRADAAGLRVGGKTGSSNKWVGGRYDAAHAVGAFAGVFPADGGAAARRHVVLVVIDEPQTASRTGGVVAAPVAGRIADRSARFLGVGRRFEPVALAAAAPPVFEDVQGDGM